MCIRDRDIDADRTYITSQNHGYAVVGESVDPQIARVRYVNLNDGTVEGLEHIGRPVFTVQYHPEVCLLYTSIRVIMTPVYILYNWKYYTAPYPYI